ncbi:MAG: hypothetical protein Q8876_10095 [Bacillota bacterium]|nr:hypothetical protein [Bacillota bacterium]
MEKMTLLKQISNLASIIHSDNVEQYDLEAGTLKELMAKLEELTTRYLALYC